MSTTTSRSALAVSHWKAGTNLVIRLMQEAGYNCMGAGTGVEPGAGSRPESVQMLGALGETGRLPEGLCFFLHQLPIDDIPLELARKLMADEHRPRVVYNYRDPRAVLVSAVNYLRRVPPPDHHARYIFIAPILARFSSTKEALPAAIDLLGDSIEQEFRSSLWLMHHPEVCSVRYEDLAGAAGGGSDRVQLETVKRVLTHVGSNRDPVEVSKKIFDTKVRTFHRGQIEGWKSDFEPHVLRKFMARYGDLVASFGYDTSAVV